MASTILRTNFESLLRPGAYVVFANYNLYPAQYKKIYRTLKSDKAAEYTIEMQGLGLAGLKNDAQQSPYGEYQQGYITNYVHNYYALAVQISRAAILDNLYSSQIPDQNMMLRSSMDTLKQINAMYIFNNAFNSNATVSDGQPLCSTEHPISNGTLANTWPDGVELSESALEDAFTVIKSWYNLGGLQIDTNTEFLLIPQYQQFRASRILNSHYRPGTANNDINAVYHDGIISNGSLINNFLKNKYAWFITTSIKGFKLFQRESLSIDFFNDITSDTISTRAIERYSFGCDNWRSVFGSAGSASPAFS